MLDDRTVHNVFETLKTFLRTRDIFIAGKILAELDYAEKPPKRYTKQELKAMFAVMNASLNEEEKLLYGLFLNSGVRDAEMQNTEYADFTWEKCMLHVQPKPWSHFRLKGKKKKKSARTGSFRYRRSSFGKSRAECESGTPSRTTWCFQTERENPMGTSCADEGDCEKSQR